MATSKIRAAEVRLSAAANQTRAELLFRCVRWLLALWLGLGACPGAWAVDAWQPTGGPDGGLVTHLVVDPSTPTTLYMGSEGGGVFKSADGGATWTAINNGLTRLYVQALAIDPSTPTTLYAGTQGGGVFKSTDGGMNWTAPSAGIAGHYVQALVVDPLSPATVYAGTFGGVFKSADGGVNWTQSNGGLTGGIYVYALAIDPVTPSTLYVATAGGSLFKSVDAGANWSPAALAAGSVRALTVDPMAPATLYAAAGSGSALMKSMDGGASWSTAIDGPAYQALSIVVDPADSSTIYAGTSGGLYRSDDAGMTWSAVVSAQTQGEQYARVASVAVTPSAMFIGAWGGVFKSSDSGANWVTANIGLKIGKVRALLVDPGAPSTLYAGVEGSGVFKSSNGGVSWSAAGIGITHTDLRALVMAPGATTTLYAGTWGGGVFKTTNGGVAWTPVNTGLTGSTVLALGIPSSMPSVVYAATNVGVFKSTNAGGSWVSASSGLATGYVNSLAIDPVTPTTLYAGLNSGGVYKSVDGGESWVASGLVDVNSLAIDPTNPSTLYAATGSGVYMSADGGLSWSSIQTGLTGSINSLVIVPSSPSTLYAGGNGAFKTTDGGGHWSIAKTGLQDTLVYSMAVDPVVPSTVYAGTLGKSVFKTTNGALSSETRLLDLVLSVEGSPVAISPPFYSTGSSFSATVHGAVSVTLTPTVWAGDAIVTVNGVPMPSGSASAPIALSTGSNNLVVTVISGDGTSTRTYTVTINRQVIAPAAPSNVQALLGAPGSGQATVSWTASASSGSSALLGYAVTGGSGCNAGPSASSCTVSGLANGAAYTFTVTAANAEGGTATSGPSNAVTPLGAQVIAFSNPGPQSFGTSPTLSATGGASGQPVTFTASPASVCTITAGGQLAFVSAGNCTVTAHQAGTAAYAAAPAVSHTFAVMAVPPSAPANVTAKPIGATQATVSWTSPANDGGGITQYTVRALINGQPSGQICTTAPPATNCTLTGLAPGVTYTFTVEAINGAGSTASPAPSNPVTPLVNPKEFSGAAPTGTGTVAVTVAGGGATCGFESVRLISPGGAVTPPPENLHFPHGLLDFVLAGCDTTNVTLTITYPDVLPQGVQYWKLRSGSWAPYAGATAGAGTTTATVVLKDGGPGDDDGNGSNGRIVDPGGAGALLATGPGGAAAIPTLSDWALVVMAGLLGVLGLRQKRPA